MSLVEIEKQPLERGGQIAVVTLYNPERRNALTVQMGEDFESAMTRLGDEDDLRALVLTGAPPAFSAGGDLDFLLARAESSHAENVEEMLAFYRRFLSMRDLGVPLIAAVNGHAIGAGLCLALACDRRIVATDAKLGATFVGLGLHPGMGATMFLPAIAGPEVTARLLFGGGIVTGEEASAMRIAGEALPGDLVLARAIAIAKKIGEQGPVAVRATVETLRAGAASGLAEALGREAEAQARCYATDDFRAGVQAMKERGTPRFIGR